MRIVLDDQQYIIAGLEIGTIILRPLNDLLHIRHWELQTWRCLAVRSFGWGNRRCCRPHIGLRNVQRKDTSLSGRASQLNLSTQKARELAADGKAKSCAAVFAARTSIRLLEGFEDDSLLILRNTDAGIRDLERNHRASGIENRMTIAPSRRH